MISLRQILARQPPMKNVTLRQLKVFESVARHRSFTRAAEELHLTQPAVSMQVKSLEEEAGLPLTEQLGKALFLTDAGAELARQARLVAQQLRLADEALAALRGLKAGRLAIGVVSTAKYFAPRLLTAFRSRHPGIELCLSVQNRDTIVRELADNEIDVAIMGSPPREPPAVADVFAEHPLVIIAAPGHPLASRRRLKAADLAGETLLIREQGSGTRAAMERFFAGQKLSLAPAIEMSSNETIKQAVMAGMGLSFISLHTIGLELAVGRIKRLAVAGTPVMRQWHLVRRADKELLPLGAAFREFLCRDGARLMREPPLAKGSP